MILDILYPQACLFCESLCDGPLCPPCLELLQPPEEGCRLCAGDDLIQKRLCRACRDQPPPIGEAIATFAHQGPALPLLATFRKHAAYLAKSLAAFMLLALQEKPTPDAIIPWPTRSSRLLADELARLFQRPLLNPFGLRLKKANLADKRLLLVHDLLTSSAELAHCAGTLQRGHPSRIDLIVLCRTTNPSCYLDP